MAASRTRLIKQRPRAGAIGGVLIALCFALLATPLATAEQWLLDDSDLVIDAEAPITIRVPQFSGYRSRIDDLAASQGAVLVARGERIDRQQSLLLRTMRAEAPPSGNAALAFGGAFFLIGLLYTGYLRRSHRGKWLRTQVVSMGVILFLAVLVKVSLLATAMSVLLVPVAAISLAAAIAVDEYAGLATGLVAAATIGLLVPFDPGAIAVLAAQAAVAVLSLHESRRTGAKIVAGLMAGCGAAVTYAVFFYFSHQIPPMNELVEPLRSSWVASLAGGVLAGIFGALLLPLYQLLLGEITRSRLSDLADLSNPMLKQISEKSPGTWQHSLAMANMAEIAANAIGANARLVRVGALYHDLGKSLQPKYFIENLGGNPSPHDNLPPEVSCDAIFAHVTEGVRLGRKEGLPERIIDFMHMHHGDGLLEYFWSKCLEQGNPKGLTERDFRYPGIRPQSRETAILAICDAVEAASRTLKNPDARAIENLVQRIVYGKLHLGQLDQSGMSMSDLRKVSNSLMETIKHAHHVRVEYPWQKEEREAREQEQRSEKATKAESPVAAVAAAARANAPRPGGRFATQRLVDEPPLDSLDRPRPYWRRAQQQSKLANAPTERADSDAFRNPATDTGSSRPRAGSPDAAPEAGQSGVRTVVARPLPPPEDEDAPPPPAAASDAPIESDERAASPGNGAVEQQAPAAEVDPPVVTEDAAPAVPAEAATLAQGSNGHAGTPDAGLDEQPGAEPETEPDGDEAPQGDDAPAAVAVAVHKGPPPAPRRRPPPNTIELMKGDGRAESVPPAQTEVHRSESEDGILEPGMMVLGPPPATHTRRNPRDEVAVPNDGKRGDS